MTRVEPTLRRLARRMSIRPDDVDDVVQESLYRIVRSLSRFVPTRGVRFTTWCCTIAANLCRDVFRRSGRRGLSLDSLESAGRELIDPGFRPVDDATDRESVDRYRRGLRALPSVHREILEMRTELDLTYEEIGREMNIPLGTVRSRMHRARAALRKLVDRETSDAA